MRTVTVVLFCVAVLSGLAYIYVSSGFVALLIVMAIFGLSFTLLTRRAG